MLEHDSLLVWAFPHARGGFLWELLIVRSMVESKLTLSADVL